MKKIVTAILLALLMVFSMAGAAFADITYASPGDVEAGTSLRHLLATVASGSTVSANDSSLPYGCYVETEETENGLNVYLSGTPSVAGSYNCVIDFGNSNSLVCPLNVLAAKPSIVVSPDVTCFPNDYIELFVNASAAGSGNLSYQWYVSSTDTNAGGQLIGGAVNSSYVANTANLGSNYYYCVVTNTSGSQTRSTVSDTIEVRVEQQQASAIHINTLPTRIEYMEGDALDTAGLSIRVDYADGSSTVLTNGFNVYPTTLDTMGIQEIQVGYMGQSCTFNVKVDTEEEIIEGIGVLKLPNKTRYEVGEDLDIKGLSIKVYTNKGEQTVSDGLSCVPSTLTIAGEQTVTVRYKGKSCTFDVTVEEKEVPIRIDVASRAQKLDYNVGDSLDTTGLIIRLTGSNGGSEEIRSGFSCEPTVLTTAGRQKITVSYEGFQCTYYVTVTEKAVQPSPSAAPATTPNPTLSPSTPSPMPTVDPGDHKPYDTGINTSLIITIMVLSLVIMLALGAFVFVMQHGGIKNMLRRFRR